MSHHFILQAVRSRYKLTKWKEFVTVKDFGKCLLVQCRDNARKLILILDSGFYREHWCGITALKLY
jgi:hypothetical protein